MTNIGVETKGFQAPNDRSWLLSMWGQGPGENPSVVIDVTAGFVSGTHYPNGYLPSGTALGVITASTDATKITVGLYDDAAGDGRSTFFGFLHSDVRVPADTSKKVGGAAVCAGFIKRSRLPIDLDANGRTDARLMHFVA